MACDCIGHTLGREIKLLRGNTKTRAMQNYMYEPAIVIFCAAVASYSVHVLCWVLFYSV